MSRRRDSEWGEMEEEQSVAYGRNEWLERLVHTASQIPIENAQGIKVDYLGQKTRRLDTFAI